MRLFIAVQFTRSIRDSLESTQYTLRKHGVKGNFTSPKNFHLTLAFLGEVREEQLWRIRKPLSSVDADPFPIGLSKSGRFRDLYWVGLAESPELQSYVDDLRKELSKHHIWYDKRAFTPHITILRRGRADHKIVIKVPRKSMMVEKISLMKSERINGRLVYTEIGSKQLTGNPKRPQEELREE